MTTGTTTGTTAETTLEACNAAARAGDEEAADRHWREFVRVLWQPMSATVPWVKKGEGSLP